MARLELISGGTVVDINYRRPDNFFESLARAAGARFRDGLPMLARQARLSFILWTGLSDAPLDPFLEGLSGGALPPPGRP
jgi:shikimate dehydrogenase